MYSIIPLFSFSLIVYIFDYTAEPLGRPPRDGRPNLGNALHIRPDPVPFPQITCGLLSADHRLSAFLKKIFVGRCLHNIYLVERLPAFTRE